MIGSFLNRTQLTNIRRPATNTLKIGFTGQVKLVELYKLISQASFLTGWIFCLLYLLEICRNILVECVKINTVLTFIFVRRIKYLKDLLALSECLIKCLEQITGECLIHSFEDLNVKAFRSATEIRNGLIEIIYCGMRWSCDLPFCITWHIYSPQNR